MMTDMLKGRTIVISGGTKGVGRILVKECARQGANVVFGGRDEPAASAVLAELNGAGFFVHTELRNVADCGRLFDAAMDKHGRVDGFVNYAGVTSVASMESCSEETFDGIFDVNIKAAFFCVQQAIRCMK